MRLWTRQPAPTPAPPGAVSAHDLVRDDLLTRGLGGVANDVMARRAVGLETYGTVLHDRDGRDHLLDGYEEILDALCYLKLAGRHTPAARAAYTVLLYAVTLLLPAVERRRKAVG